MCVHNGLEQPCQLPQCQNAYFVSHRKAAPPAQVGYSQYANDPVLICLGVSPDESYQAAPPDASAYKSYQATPPPPRLPAIPTPAPAVPPPVPSVPRAPSLQRFGSSSFGAADDKYPRPANFEPLLPQGQPSSPVPSRSFSPQLPSPPSLGRGGSEQKIPAQASVPLRAAPQPQLWPKNPTLEEKSAANKLRNEYLDKQAEGASPAVKTA